MTLAKQPQMITLTIIFLCEVAIVLGRPISEFKNYLVIDLIILDYPLNPKESQILLVGNGKIKLHLISSSQFDSKYNSSLLYSDRMSFIVPFRSYCFAGGDPELKGFNLYSSYNKYMIEDIYYQMSGSLIINSFCFQLRYCAIIKSLILHFFEQMNNLNYSDLYTRILNSICVQYIHNKLQYSENSHVTFRFILAGYSENLDRKCIVIPIESWGTLQIEYISSEKNTLTYRKSLLSPSIENTLVYITERKKVFSFLECFLVQFILIFIFVLPASSKLR